MTIRKYNLRNICLILGCVTFFINTNPAYAQPSIINTLQNSLKSIVHIKSENAIVAKGPTSLVKDAKTGRLLVVRRAKGSKFDREGSGVIINPAGLIITSAHIVQQATHITVTLYDNTELSAQVAWIAPQDDIALLRIKPKSPLISLTFSSPDKIKLSATVYTIGSSRLLDGTISQGKIRGIGQRRRSRDKKFDFADLLQITFNVYKGDSGAPILDEDGDLLGLIVAAQSKESRSSFAIPIYKIIAYYNKYLEVNPI